MDQYVGEIRLFGGNFAPQGWLLCDGTAYDNNRYSTLYSIIMETYGGNGHMFNVPDLRGRAPIQWGKGVGLSGYEIGKQAGVEQVTLSVPQLPAHTHNLQGVAAGANQISPENNYLAIAVENVSESATKSYNDRTDTSLALKNLKSDSILPTGGSVPVPIVSPLLAITFIIAHEGIYPPRP